MEHYQYIGGDDKLFRIEFTAGTRNECAVSSMESNLTTKLVRRLFGIPVSYDRKVTSTVELAEEEKRV